MKKIFAAVFFVPCAAILFSQGVSGTPSRGDVAAVMSCLMYAIYRGESDEGKSGGNMDSSLRWEKSYAVVEAQADPSRGRHKPGPREELESVTYSFNGYSFYAVQGNGGGRHPQKPQVITIDGSLMLLISKNSALTCNIAVRGADSVRTVALNGFQPDGTQGTARVNGSEYDAETLRDLDWLDAVIIDADMESGIIFFNCFMAMLTTDISEQLEALGEDAQNEVPAGITAVNPQNTLKITTKKNQLDMAFNDFALSELYEFSPSSPRISGTLTMNIDVQEYDIEAIRYSGKIDVRDMVFVTSMEFDKCIITGNMRELSGTITVNGKARPFSQFVYALKSAEAFF